MTDLLFILTYIRELTDEHGRVSIDILGSVTLDFVCHFKDAETFFLALDRHVVQGLERANAQKKKV